MKTQGPNKPGATVSARLDEPARNCRLTQRFCTTALPRLTAVRCQNSVQKLSCERWMVATAALRFWPANAAAACRAAGSGLLQPLNVSHISWFVTTCASKAAEPETPG